MTMQRFFICVFLLFVSTIVAMEYYSIEEEHTQNNLLPRLTEHVHYNLTGPNTIGHITIDDRDSGINQATFLYVKGALDHYKQTKPAFVILELNTPGGEVFAAQRISDALKDLDTQFDIPVVAFINNWAISAGAMLAYSCRFITVVKDGSMGAAEPVTMSAEGQKMETASEKVNSALRADFANRANFFDRNPLIAQAMVDKDMILVLRDNKITKLDNEKDIRSEPTPDIIISPKGKLLTLSAEEMMHYGVADMLMLPKKLEQITPQEKSAGKWPASKTLLFQQPFFNNIPNATIDSYKMDWKTRFFTILANPVVASILFLGLMIGGYMEMSTPGFGLAGTVALVCLFLIFLSSFAMDAINWLEVIFFFAGILIIIAELFILPTFGLLGFIGIILFMVGLFGIMTPGVNSVAVDLDTKTLNAAGEFVFQRFAWLCGTLIIGVFIVAFLARYVVPRFPLFHRFVLSGNEQVASEGYTAGGDLSMPAPGTKGIVAATLRPSGKVTIGDNLYDAISEGDFIEKGTPIVVVRVEGSKVIVNIERG